MKIAKICDLRKFNPAKVKAFTVSHPQRDTWMPTIGEEFVCSQELANENDAHAVAMYEDEDEVLGHIPWEFSRVAFQFLEHGGSITSRDTGRR